MTTHNRLLKVKLMISKKILHDLYHQSNDFHIKIKPATITTGIVAELVFIRIQNLSPHQPLESSSIFWPYPSIHATICNYVSSINHMNISNIDIRND